MTEAVAQSVGIPPDDVVLVAAGTVPKTSSGKIQRSAIRSTYESGDLAARAAKPTWVQLAKVGIRAGVRSAAKTVGRGSGAILGSLRRLFGWSVAALFGLLARLAPSPGMARRAIAPGAVVLSALRGARCRERIGASGATGLMLVNRLDGCDALVVAAALRGSFVFADRTAFSGLSSAEAFLLDPLVAPPVDGVSAPRAADLQLRMQAAIAGGQSVVSFADSAAGASPARTRFRAEGFAAAAATGAPLIPVHLGRAEAQAVAAIQGAPIHVSPSDGELASVRARVREVLAQASGSTPG